MYSNNHYVCSYRNHIVYAQNFIKMLHDVSSVKFIIVMLTILTVLFINSIKNVERFFFRFEKNIHYLL